MGFDEWRFPQPPVYGKDPVPPVPFSRQTRYVMRYLWSYREYDVFVDETGTHSQMGYHGDSEGFTLLGEDGENVKFHIDVREYDRWRTAKGEPPVLIPLIPTGYVYSSPPVEVDEPPWPFNWIKGVFEGAGGLGEWLGGGLGFISNGLVGLGLSIANLPLALFSMFTDKLDDLMTKGSSESLKLAINTLKGTLEGSPQLIADLEESVVDQTAGAVAVSGLTQMEIEKGEAGVEPKAAWIALKTMSEGIINAGTGLYLQHAVMEGGSLGQFEFVRDLKSLVLNNYAYEEISKKRWMMPAEMSVIKPAMYYLNSIYQPEIPPYTDLINMRVKEKITDAEFVDNLLKWGYSPKWAARIWDAHFQAPSYGDIIKAYWRGAFKYDRLLELLERVDLDPEYNEEVFLKLITEIPPYSELVNQRVKEVLTDAEFLKYIKYYGFDPVWASRIWDAHFAPASFADFLTAMRRGETVSIPRAGQEPIEHKFGEDAAKDIEIIRDLSVLADYDPRYWSFFKTRVYNDPTPRMARWAFEVGALTPDQVEEVVHRFGYRPEDEKWFTDMLLGFQERTWVTKYLTACATAYINGAIDQTELTKRVVEVAGRNKAIAEWIVRIADVRKEMATTGTARAQKLLGLGDLKKAFLHDKIKSDVLRSELLLRGYDVGDIDILVSLLEDEKVVEEAGGRKVALSISQLINAWRFNVITEDEIRTQLQLRGLSQDEVETILETKKRQWGLITPD